VNEAIDLNIHMNDILTSGIIDPSLRKKAINSLKPLKRANSAAIDRSIRQLGDQPYNLWRTTQNAHASWVNRYSKDIVLDLLDKNIDYDAVAQKFDDTKNIRDLKDVTTPDVHPIIERRVLDELNLKKPSAQLRESWRDKRHALTDRAATAGERLIENNDPLSAPSRGMEKANAIISDINEAAETGSVPKKTLTMMHNPREYEFVRRVLSETQAGRQALDTLHEMFIQEHMTAVFPQGTMNIKALDALLKNRDVMNLMTRMTGNNELPQFLRNLERNNSRWKNLFEESVFTEETPEPKRFPNDKPYEKLSKQPRREPPRATLKTPLKWIRQNAQDLRYVYGGLRRMGMPSSKKVDAVFIGTEALPRFVDILGNRKVTKMMNELGNESKRP
jgi:hypothetical protein